MVTVSWICITCGEAGKIVIQYSKSTPIVPTVGDYLMAKMLAKQEIKHRVDHEVRVMIPLFDAA